MPMRLLNSDVDEAERVCLAPEEDLEEKEGGAEGLRSFFELRQRTLLGMDPLPAFRLVVLGLLRKLRTNAKGTVLYLELEDALGRYFRLLDSDMQRFASLHETLRDATHKEDVSAVSGSRALLLDGMRQIAVVLLACGEVQQRSLDMKIGAQMSISQSSVSAPAHVSFTKYAEFFEEALAVCDQLKKKHEELQQLRIRAMASAVDAKTANSNGTCAGAAKTQKIVEEEQAVT